jgi:hypothetical protein
VIVGPCKLIMEPWNVISGLCEMIILRCNVIMGPRNVNRGRGM